MAKKGDIILVGVIAAIIMAYFGYTLVSRLLADETYAIIEVDGKDEHRIELKKDAPEQIIEIKQDKGQVNIVRIKDGKAKMIEANCPDKRCIEKFKATNTPGSSIICIPNRVFVFIKGEKSDDIDIVVD